MSSRQSRGVAARVCRALLGLAFALPLVAAGPTRAAVAVICVPTTCDVSCTATAATIQLGIDAASAGDTVLVCPGIYAETVTAGHGGVTSGAAGIDIDKSLTLKSTGGSGVTTITNGVLTPGGHCLPTSCPGGPVQLVTLSASGITIDGFTILETDPPINLITADGDADSKNHTLKNNVIKNPTFNDDVCSGGGTNDGTPCTSDGVCTGGGTCGPTGGGWGILLGGTMVSGADNNTITGNEISLNPDLTKNEFTFGIGLSGGGAGSNDNNVISDNSLHDMGFGGFGDKNDTNTTVSGNTFMDLAKVGWQDFGSTSGEMILGNTFDNAGRAGLEIRNGAQNVTVTNNCFSLNGSSPPTFSPCQPANGPCTVTPFGGIRIEDDGASPGTMGTMIHNNNFAGNNVPNGVTDNTAASTDTDGEAESNWWGCAAGPGNAGCDSVTANVDFTPFLTSEATGTPCTPTTTTTTTSSAAPTTTTSTTTTSTTTTTRPTTTTTSTTTTTTKKKTTTTTTPTSTTTTMRPVSGSMTGGGNELTTTGQTVTFNGGTQQRATQGLLLHCNAASQPNNLQVNWANNSFHLQQLVSATCSNDGMSPQPPPAGFDVIQGSGTGKCNKLAATVTFKFADHGEPGTNDTVEIHITGGCTLDVSGNLQGGDIQAHN